MTLRVLTISKPYVAAAYRDKILKMAEDPRLAVGLVCPPQWGNQKFEQQSETDPSECSYPCYQVPIYFNGHNHFHCYHQGAIKDVFKKFKPDIVNIEEEHYSFVTYQLTNLAHQFGAKTLFYTWQNIDKKYPPPFSWIEQSVFRRSSAAVVGNNEAGTILRRKGFKGPIEYIPQMGVNENLFPSTIQSQIEKNSYKHKLGLRDDLLWILYCGRLVPEKGVSILLESLSDLASSNTPCGVILLGDGPERSRLTSYLPGLTPQIPVKLIPFVPSHEVVHWMLAADILCLPSITQTNWKEQFGRVLVEAMACSTVPVGSHSGEIPHVIENAGLIFKEKDPKDLASCLKRLIESPTDRDSFKRKGFLRVQQNYTHKVIANTLCNLLVRMGQNR